MLKQDEFGKFLDKDGLTWDNPVDWFWSGLLGFCGCGTAEYHSVDMFEVLEHFLIPIENRKKLPEKYEIHAYVLDKHEFIEHGSSILYGWMTDKGRNVYQFLKPFIEQLVKDIEKEN